MSSKLSSAWNNGCLADSQVDKEQEQDEPLQERLTSEPGSYSSRRTLRSFNFLPFCFIFICFFWKYQLHKLPAGRWSNPYFWLLPHFCGDCLSFIFTAFLVQDTINVSRGGDGKDGRGEANPKGINRLSCEFQYFYLISLPPFQW